MTTLPQVFVELAGSWPPARDGMPVGTSAVSSWSMERELVGSTLPGNVRGRSGLSVGSASIEIPQTSTGKPLAPWATGDRKVTTGDPVDLYAAETHDGARAALGDWQVAPVSGALMSPGVDIQLIEGSFEGRKKPAALPIIGEDFTSCDPIALIDILARQAGYYSTPPIGPTTLVSVPLQGGQLAEPGTAGYRDQITPTFGPAPASWDRALGVITPRWAAGAYIVLPGPGDVVHTGGDIFATFCLDGQVELRLFGFTPALAPTAGIRVTAAGSLSVTNTGASWTAGTFTPGASTDWPTRVQVQMQRIGTPGSYSAFRARARSSHEAAWGTWVTQSTAATDEVSTYALLTTPPADSVAAIQMTTAAEAHLWTPLTAYLEMLGGDMSAPWVPAEWDAWTAIQEICEKRLGAAIVGLDKVLRVRGREFLAGDASTPAVLDVATAVEDVAWTIDPADRADRLVVTYNPPTWTEQNDDEIPPLFVLWESPDPVEIPARSTVSVVAELSMAGKGMMPFEHDWRTSIKRWSTWNARTSLNGAGGEPSEDALQVEVDLRASTIGRAVIRITNNTGVTLYTVDSSGAAALVLRAVSVAPHDTPRQIARGLSADEAQAPLEVNLDHLVQNEADATEIADFIWGRVSAPMWKANSVRVQLDWSIDIGDVRHVTHEPSGLDVVAMVTKVSLSGQAGEVVQTLDLVLLPPTWTGFDESWSAAGTWDDFDALWADGSTWTDFDNDPLRSA